MSYRAKTAITITVPKIARMAPRHAAGLTAFLLLLAHTPAPLTADDPRPTKTPALPAAETNDGKDGDGSDGRASGENEGATMRECSDCDIKGKQPCPDCDGRGQLYKTCTKCDGKGRRPCTVCARDEKSETDDDGKLSPPGYVDCTKCGADGTIGQNNPRPCYDCAGEGMLACPTCLGKATLRCKTEVFVKICSRCKLTGKVVCLTCAGKRLVPVIRTRRKASPKSAPRVDDTQATGSLLSLQDQPLEDRFTQLLRLFERTVHFAEEGSVPDLRGIYKEAAHLEKQLANADTEEAEAIASKLRNLRRSITQVRGSWDEVAAAIESFGKTFKSCDARWRKRQDATTEKSREEWNEQMRLALRISERRARKLTKIDFDGVFGDVERTRLLWVDSERLANQHLAEMKASNAASAPRADAEKASDVREIAKPSTGRTRASKVSRRAREVGSRGKQEPRENAPRSEDLPATRDDGEETGETLADKTDPAGDAEGSGGFLSGFLGGAAAMIAILIAFLTYQKRQRRAAARAWE